MTIFFRGDNLTLFPVQKGYIRPDSMLYQRILCGGEPGCETSAAYTGRRLRDWLGRWTSWTVSSDSGLSARPDLVLRHKWRFDGYVVDSFNVRLRGSQSPERTIRCDSATYFGLRRRGACIADDVIPHLQYSMAQRSEVKEVAEHIQCAQNSLSCVTFPIGPAAKLIPGKFVDGDRNDMLALHRVRSAKTNSPIADANRAVVRAACAKLPVSVYDPSNGQQCDEYPFASTMEGAACCDPPAFDWDYSIKGVPADVNNCAGNALKKYYREDRILYQQDGYFVRITNTPPSGPQFCDAIPPEDDEPDGDGGTPPPDLPPTANAGPDVSGDEGSQIAVFGTASDPELGTPHVAWSYRPISNVDPGASCSFGGSNEAQTTVTCTDDGVFQLTITAYDGANPPVSDTATLTLANVAPSLHDPDRPGARLAIDEPPGPPQLPDGPGLVAPVPWQVYRVGDPVTLTAVYREPAENDTATCVTTWDDGSTSTVNGADLTCQDGHTFSHAGMYTLTTTVTDDDGGSGDASVLVIVYDPDAGFATAGGFIDSPAGALSSAPDSQGKLHFQFNPKYKTPDEGPAPSGGKVKAGLQGTDFSLASTGLEWLVVTTDGKVAVKGTGTVDGQPGYGFVVYGYEQPDMMRLVVWSLSDGSIPAARTVYDNRPGADFDLDVARPQALAGGSIQVHQ